MTESNADFHRAKEKSLPRFPIICANRSLTVADGYNQKIFNTFADACPCASSDDAGRRSQ
jgi:hypothetical protein